MAVRKARLFLLLVMFSSACAEARDTADAGSAGPSDATFDAPGNTPFDAPVTSDAMPVDAAVADATVTSCEGPIDITAGGTQAGQTTVGSADSLSPPIGNGCPSGGLNSGPDVAYVVKPAADTSYSVTITPGDTVYDPMVYAMTSCDFDIGCYAGSVLNGAGDPETIIFTAGANETVYVIVDGEAGTSGPYSISVTATPL